jgi:arsenate reductase
VGIPDIVITVCANAAGETCPAYLVSNPKQQTLRTHWGVEDPAAVEGSDEVKRRAFLSAYTQLQHRINIFANLPLDRIDRLSLRRKLDDIGRTRGTDAAP